MVQSLSWEANWFAASQEFPRISRNPKAHYRTHNITCININSQLDAKITNFIDNYNQLNMFRAIISPILRSTRLSLQLVV